VQFRVDKRSISPYWHIWGYVTNNNQHDFSLSHISDADPDAPINSFNGRIHQEVDPAVTFANANSAN